MRATLFAIVLAVADCTTAGDWPRWRGPLNDGSAVGEAPLATLPGSPEVLWSVELGEGLSSPVVANGRLAIMDNEDGREVLHLLEAATGRELWTAAIDDVFKDSQGPPGPRNTAVFDGELVYAVSCKGELQCRRVTDGGLVWRTSYTNDLHATFIGEKGNAPGATRHGNNGPPLIDGPHLIAPAGGRDGHSVVCFDKLTGSMVWHSQDDEAGYGAPVVVEIAGVRQVIAFTVEGVIGLHRGDGRLLWRVPMKTAYGRHVMTPVVHGDLVVAGSHQTGLIGIRVSRDGDQFTATEQWKSMDAAPNFAHPVAVDGHLFTLGPRKNIQCVDLADGSVKWSEEGIVVTAPAKSYAGFVTIGGNILTLTDTGEFVLFRAAAEGCEILGRAQVAGANWCNPAYANGVAYLRDDIKSRGKLMAVRLR